MRFSRMTRRANREVRIERNDQKYNSCSLKSFWILEKHRLFIRCPSSQQRPSFFRASEMVIHDVWQHAGQEVRFDSELLALYQELTSPKLLCQPGFLEMS